MSLKTLLLTLAVAGVTANLIMKSRRTPVAAGNAGLPVDDLPRADTGLQASSDTGMPGMGTSSMNMAERMEDDNLTGSPIGNGTPAADAGLAEDPFESSSQKGSGPSTTGLGDYSRGA
ncbi:hypothetical protein [Ideonella sp. BN130291]|uniref:hypothetical protein n=1 Tax=Ideonella sp. BN130291 TaxID=3112940 RepID=UPI002E254533|nr:hypothetical protein [Ideonella sp. BN130291]